MTDENSVRSESTSVFPKNRTSARSTQAPALANVLQRSNDIMVLTPRHLRREGTSGTHVRRNDAGIPVLNGKAWLSRWPIPPGTSRGRRDVEFNRSVDCLGTPASHYSMFNNKRRDRRDSDGASGFLRRVHCYRRGLGSPSIAPSGFVRFRARASSAQMRAVRTGLIALSIEKRAFAEKG
jgi:hypothetical protein